jgi:hypothetical protein
MVEIVAVIGAVIAAAVIWLTVQIVNRPDRREWIARSLLKLLVAYFVVSVVTLPFVDRWWLGEMALLALIQLPKVTLARWCQHELVIRGMHIAGLSTGSMSPDLNASRPWGLLLAYVFALGPVFALIWYRTHLKEPYGRMALILAAAAVIDFCLTLRLAGGPGLSIY